MKTKILYVLVSSEADVYLEQALVSAYSARRHNPDAVLTLLSDTDTLRSLPQRSPLLDSLFQEKVPVDFGADVPPMTRSRLLKTGMRNYVDGDFLYIDAYAGGGPRRLPGPAQPVPVPSPSSTYGKYVPPAGL